MRQFKEILRDERTHAAMRRALAVTARHTGRGVVASARMGWRFSKWAAGAIAARLRERRTLRLGGEADFVSPFDGKPLTHMIKSSGGGLAAVVIEPVVLTPLRAKFADFLGGVSAFALMGLSLALVDLCDRPAGYWWFIALLWPWPFTVLLQKCWRILLRRRSVLMFTTGQFSVRHGEGRTTVYDREIPHRFRLDNRHEKARKEAERHEVIQARAGAKGMIIRKTKYQRETLHLMIDYRGQPRKVMEIMGQDDALLVLARVKAIDEVMDELVKMGRALTKGPKSEWDDMPGKIPTTV
jgi:hypothetical protein